MGRQTIPPSCSGVGDLGWFGLPFPEEGGGGGGPIELILAEELGRASLDIAMTYIGTLIPGLTSTNGATRRSGRASGRG